MMHGLFVIIDVLNDYIPLLEDHSGTRQRTLNSWIPSASADPAGKANPVGGRKKGGKKKGAKK